MAAPFVTTIPNTADSDASPTTVSALVTPNGLDTSVYFTWGPELNYFYATPAQDIGAGSAAVLVSASIPTDPGTFHFNTVATNNAGSTFGTDQTFDVDTSFTDGVLGSGTAWTQYSTDLTNYMTAIGQLFEETYKLVISQGDPDDDDYEAGWSNLLNVDECPTDLLPFLGMFVGVEVPPGTDDATARSRIRDEAGFKRGTLAAMQTAADRNLVGATATILERTSNDGVTSDAYHVCVFFPANSYTDLQKLIADVEAVKPGGIQITYGESVFNTWNQAIHTWNQDTMAWDETNNQQA